MAKTAATIEQFSIEARGIGCFPNPRRPRIVWAGIGGGARSTQSDGTQNIKLPNTQMTMVVPRFVLTRSSGSPSILRVSSASFCSSSV